MKKKYEFKEITKYFDMEYTDNKREYMTDNTNRFKPNIKDLARLGAEIMRLRDEVNILKKKVQK